MDIPLSLQEVREIANIDFRFIPATQLIHYNIDNLFDINNVCLINYLESDHMGHWVCLIRNKNNIYYFNPFGFEISAMLYLPPYNQMKGQELPYLRHILGHSKYRIYYNDYHIQDLDSNLCGRYVGLYIRMSQLDKKYLQFSTFKKNKWVKDPNKLIWITNAILFNDTI